MKISKKKIVVKCLFIAVILMAFFLIVLLELFVASLGLLPLIAALVLSLLLNTAFIFFILRRWGRLEPIAEHRLNLGLDIAFGSVCYLGLLTQMGVLFFFYYMVTGNQSILPPKLLAAAALQPENLGLDEVFNHVFPYFYRFPVNSGMMPVVQFYTGKFVDLFVLAYLVDVVRRPQQSIRRRWPQDKP